MLAVSCAATEIWITFALGMNQKLRSDLYTATVWAVFTLGATQLALVLAGPVIYMIAMLFCAAVLAFVLYKGVEPGNRSRKVIARPHLISMGILLGLNVLYISVVFLQAGLSNVIFFSVHTFLFMIPLLVTLPFVRKRSHVSR